MPNQTILSDTFLRQLMAAGQVDLLVGLPTFNNASTASTVLKAVHVSFANHFARQRTVLVNCDGGSHDGTPDIVRSASVDDSDTLIASRPLRTVHRISTPYHGLVGKGSALRAILAAADLAQAGAVVVLDPDVTSVTPDWVDRLARPVLDSSCDFVSPVYPRHRFDGTLIHQLVRPMLQATYGRRVREPVGGEFACSGRFAAHCVRAPVWQLDFMRYGADTWLLGEAIAHGYSVGQSALGPRVLTHGPVRPGLAEIVQQIVGALFRCMELHAAYWPDVKGSEPVAGFGDLDPAAGAEEIPDTEATWATFTTSFDDLEPLLKQAVSPGTLSGLKGVSQMAPGKGAFTDELWGHALGEFAAAYHHEALGRDHLMKMLVPLYLGRLASFVETHRYSDGAAVEAACGALGETFETLKPDWVQRWKA